MQLGFGLDFEELYKRDGLVALDARFVETLKLADAELHARLMTARAAPEALSDKEHSLLLLALAPHVEDFIAALFGVQKELRALAAAHHALAPLYVCKRLFVQRRAAKAYPQEEAAGFDGEALIERLIVGRWPLVENEDTNHIFSTNGQRPTINDSFELAFATQVMEWLDAPEAHAEALEAAQRYAAWALYSKKGQEKHRHGVLFKLPKKLDPMHLLELETEVRHGVTMLKLPEAHLRVRDGFALTDAGGTLAQALDHANYCIFCAHQGKDSCSKGFREKDNSFKKNALGVTLTGCPLEEKISEMNELKAKGLPIGALAVVCVDNPLCAGTGHRICNDCMKGCIYQKQEPVNIPLNETRVLNDVLSLPYGFEIYSLLTRWNPLHLTRPLPKEATGGRVLVAGLGPAGYTLSHHLLNDGHTVAAVDGLKLEPLPSHLRELRPIRDVAELREPLESRTQAGFGGVAEYGITVRWDKNYLAIIRLLLERRDQFRAFGGVRFGSTITYEDAFALGFDHVALCLGAGKPTILEIPNGMARGVRTASDFLMSLQLTGAAKKDSIANLQLRLPSIVIGGGLTAIDTATEAMAYYPVQVEKFLQRFEYLSARHGETAVRQDWDVEEREIAEEFLGHARAIRAEREAALNEGRTPDFVPLLKGWGGVTVAYRKRLVDAPSYRLNHEEVEKGFEEGIFFAENLEPVAVELDGYGHTKGVRFREGGSGIGDWGLENTPNPKSQIPFFYLPARTVLIAAGTSPNTVLAREDAVHFLMDGRYFRSIDEEGHPVTPERVAKPGAAHVLMSLDEQGRSVSFFGDLHPSFAGNVVKAMASAKQGYPVVSRAVGRRVASCQLHDARKENFACNAQFSTFVHALSNQLAPRIHAVNRLTPTIVEVVVEAPLAAKNFQPGQFYRLQNFEAYAKRVASCELRVARKENSTGNSQLATTLTMEGLAMTGAWVDAEKGLVAVIALEMGGSSDLCAQLVPGEPVVLMGPTGAPTELPENETVLLVGGGLGNAVLFSIGKALRARGSRVLYFAGYKKIQDRYKVEQIEAAADAVVWACDEAPGFAATRPQDMSFVGNIVDAMAAYAEGRIQDSGFGIQGKREDRTETGSLNPESRIPIPLAEVTRIIAIGSAGMMAAVGRSRHTLLRRYLSESHTAVGSINSPMQCMMKEICAQCLQEHVHPETGKISYVYSCFNQDQCLDDVSFQHLNERLRQNSVQEKLTVQWIAECVR